MNSCRALTAAWLKASQKRSCNSKDFILRYIIFVYFNIILNTDTSKSKLCS